MDGVTQKRWRVIVTTAYYALILGAFYLIFKTFFGVLFPFIVAFLIAALLHRPVQYITRKTPLNRSMVSTVFVLLILGAIGALLFFAGSSLVEKIKDFYAFIVMKARDITSLTEQLKGWAISAISFLPDKLRLSLTDSISTFFDGIVEKDVQSLTSSAFSLNWSSILPKGVGMLKNTVGQIPSVLIGALIAIVSCVFITIDYDKIIAFVMRQFSEDRREKILNAKNLAVKTLGQMAKAYGLIILITTTELTIGFYIMKFCKIFSSDYIVLIALIIAIIDIIPVLGTGTVLIPWSVYSFITGDIPMGVALIILYVVILVIRQVLEPKLVAGQVGLSPFVTIMAMYVGTKTLGVLGFFILPFCVILIKKFNDEGIIHLFKSASAEPAPVPAAQETPPAEDAAPAEDGEIK